MPILAGIISSILFQVFAVFSAKLTFNIAFTAAIVAVSLAAFIAMKAAMAAVWALVPLITPAPVVVGLQLLLPGNLASVIMSMILVDVIAVSWDYWKLTAGLVAATVKA